MAKVQPVPKGYHSVTPFLSIKGADQALEFYKRAFGAVEKFRSPGPDGKIMHAEVTIGDSTIMLSEALREPPSVSSMYVYVPAADKAFDRAVKDGVTVKVQSEDRFVGDRNASV